jgi:hypothetical protein
VVVVRWGFGAAAARRPRRRNDEGEGHDWECATRAVCGHQRSSIARQKLDVGTYLILRLSGAPVYGWSRGAFCLLNKGEPWALRGHPRAKTVHAERRAHGM